jgi:hypothetical protein
VRSWEEEEEEEEDEEEEQEEEERTKNLPFCRDWPGECG